MKAVRQQSESPAAHDHDLVEQFLQESAYLPVQGDQSWREQAALRIGAGYIESDEIETPAAIPTHPDRLSESNVHAGGNRGGLLVAFFAIAIILPAVVLLTAPDILTADFWRAQREASPPQPGAPPVQTANVPAANVQAPVIAKEMPHPSPSRDAQVSKPPPVTKPLPSKAPALRPADTAQNSMPRSNQQREQASPTTSRPATRTANRDGGSSGFGSFVLGPDGRLQYRYFPTASSDQPAVPAQAEDSDPGFYAMVPDPDGTLRYKHFPSKPAP